MRRLKWITAVVTLALIAWLGEREVRDRINKRHAYPVIAELGGRIGSLTPPIPFAGSEIRIWFRGKQFKDGDLKRLSVVRPLTEIHHVAIAFIDSNITEEEIVELRAMLPGCVIFRQQDGQAANNR